MIRVLHDNNHLWHTQINQSTKHNAGLGIMITALSDVDLRCFLMRGRREVERNQCGEALIQMELCWAEHLIHSTAAEMDEHHQHREDKSRFWSEDESQVLTGHMLTGCEGCGLKWNLPIHSKGTVHPKSNSEWGRVLSSSLDRAWLT